MTKYHFLDESGDLGINQSGTSSPYFILALVELSNREPLAELLAVRQELGLPSRYEFKHYKARRSLKDVFFAAIQPLSFQVRVLVLEKEKSPPEFKRLGGPDLMVELFARLASGIPESEIGNDILIIDGAKPQLIRNLHRRLSQESRRIGRKRLFKKIVSQNSQGSDGLQLADMIAGAIRQHVMGQESCYFMQIKSKIKGYWQI
ncbi:MAG: DUF3800 domain-containing protein [Chloroflexota bacterium]